MRRPYALSVAIAAALALAACQRVDNTAGAPTVYIDPGTSGPVKGVGIESQDVIAMTDQMLRDMLSQPRLANAAMPPNVIIDSEYFHNESSSRLNKNSITDRLRVGLNRAAAGRMQFVGRHYADMVAKERDLKRQGTVDKATLPAAGAQKGGDYRLGGRITSLDSRDPKTGMMQRYNQIIFEMVDLETSEIVWSGIYEFAKAAQDDIIYR
ncbi:penicillin-binding protein activator LpoB [Paramagnetospirillum kuznetsovii]|uniref:Penicillin-binding protein activator LpoB n=1 Tax=Paramagnetospirillum kuznetsovii TaxID=2053833 RepID=A0A364NX99_9PROT|nr:penicillin-binding protein activator LpoB [Paramagnetospirillum kuznetsovii]RAU21525.1 penicillin-binding protein activator LpoB [Paramagnetospirillum kuznetsovii]